MSGQLKNTSGGNRMNQRKAVDQNMVARIKEKVNQLNSALEKAAYLGLEVTVEQRQGLREEVGRPAGTTRMVPCVELKATVRRLVEAAAP